MRRYKVKFYDIVMNKQKEIIYMTWQILLYCWLLPIKSQIISSKRLGKRQLYTSMHANFSSLVNFSSFLW